MLLSVVFMFEKQQLLHQKWYRPVASGRGLGPQFLTDQLTLSQPGGHVIITQYYKPHRIFRPCNSPVVCWLPASFCFCFEPETFHYFCKHGKLLHLGFIHSNSNCFLSTFYKDKTVCTDLELELLLNRKLLQYWLYNCLLPKKLPKVGFKLKSLLWKAIFSCVILMPE